MTGRTTAKARAVARPGDKLSASFSGSGFTKARSSGKRVSGLFIPKAFTQSDLESCYQDGDVELTKRVLMRFNYFTSAAKQSLIISLIKLCDHRDLNYLSNKLPRLHRDFLALLPAEINYKILTYIYPRDLCSLVCVSKTWAKVATDPKAWETIYRRLGLLEMAHNCYMPEFPMIDNAKRFSALRNWSKGVFTLKHIKAHPLGILCIAFDGKHIATGSVDRTCRIFDVRNGQCLYSLNGHEQKLYCIALSGNRVYTGSSDKSINIWDLENEGRLIGTLTGHEGTVTCLKCKGNKLFSSSDDKTIRIWNVSNEALHEIDKKPVDSKPTTPGGLVTESRGIKRHPCLLRVLHGHTSGVRSFDVHQQILFSGDIYGMVRVWHVDSGNCLCVIKILPDGKYEMEVLELLSISVNRTLPAPVIASDPITAIQYTGHRFVVATFSGNAFIYKIKPNKTNDTSYTMLRNWINADDTISFSSKYKIKSIGERKKTSDTWALSAYSDTWRLMVGGSEGLCMLWNHQNEKMLYELKGNKIDNGTGPKPLVVGEYVGAKALDPSFESLKDSGNRTERAITGVAFDDHYIVAGGMDGIIRIWEASVK